MSLDVVESKEHVDALNALRTSLLSLERVVVAFSGGADSSLLAYVANDVLGSDRVLCATAVSASLPATERNDCASLASEWNMRHVFVETDELANAAYVRNDLNRCYFCKDELMGALHPWAAEEQATIVLGVNLDDLGEHRPGQEAARTHGAVFPLVDAQLSKELVRSLSRQLGLRTWDKPAAACLASRIPHGTPVTVEILSRVERAEDGLRQLGFSTLRVRHYGECARIELDQTDLARAIEEREAIVSTIKSAGYHYVTLDLEGFRSGNLASDALRKTKGARER